MRTRHKPPSLVSMWMLDVFCCALGCVTLLWLLSTRSAQEEAAHNREAVELLARAESDLNRAHTEAVNTANRARIERDALQTRLISTTAERDALKPRLAEVDAQLAAVRVELKATGADRDTLTAKLDSEAKRVASLATKLDDASKKADQTAESLDAKRAELAKAEARVEAATKALAEGQREMAAVGKESRATGDTLRQTADELTKTRATIVDLQGQKAKLADKFDKLQSDADARFAGIALTGRRVVFLVDISGSMKLVDERTPAPDKWPTVIQTIARVMRSLPQLEKFQVITFSKRPDYLFPGGVWQDYNGEASVKRVSEALARVNPDGDTNMYDALELAFRQKAAGLDTLYLFSDGLPTSGPGLTALDEQTTPAQARSDKLAKHVLQTLRATWNRPGGNRVRINAVGFFFESPDVGAFLWALARDNDGSFVGMSRP